MDEILTQFKTKIELKELILQKFLKDIKFYKQELEEEIF